MSFSRHECPNLHFWGNRCIADLNLSNMTFISNKNLPFIEKVFLPFNEKIHTFDYVDHVLFFVGPNNLRSRKAVEKLGAVYVDTRSRFGGESVVYRLSKADFTSY